MECFWEGVIEPALTRINTNIEKFIFTYMKQKVDGFSASKIKNKEVKLSCQWIGALRSMTADKMGF
jgi:hypothetical protein